MKTISTEDIKGVLEGLSARITEDNKTIFESVAETDGVKKAVQAIKDFDVEKFYFALPYSLDNMLSGLVEACLPELPKAHFLLTNSKFVSRHIRRNIERHEGSACCADKTRTIMGALLKFLVTKQEIVFDYDQRFTYHLPDKLFKSHAEIVLFFEALYQLYYGNSDAYLIWKQTVTLA